jgi:DNA-binding transcriptional ArsR family regulator
MEELKFFLDDLRLLLNKNRIEILKILRRRKYTASELAKLLNLSVPTVLYHLSILESIGFVKRHDSERKWVYYELTEKGSRFLSGILKIVLASCTVALILLTALSPKDTTQKPLGGTASPIFTVIALAILILMVYFIIKLIKK